MSQLPRISVLIPAYNARDCLGACLDSVLPQGGVELQIVAVDDASDDGTAELLDARAAADPRLTVVHRANNGGEGPARSSGLALCDGDWLLCVDADDELEPGSLARLMELARDSAADVLLFRHVEVDGEREWEPPSPLADDAPLYEEFDPTTRADALYTTWLSCVWNKCFRLSHIRACGLDFQPVRRIADTYFSLMALSCARRVGIANLLVYRYRIHVAGSLTSMGDRSPAVFCEVCERLYDGLHESGRWPAFEVAFYNWVAENLPYNLTTMKTAAGFSALVDAFRARGCEHIRFLEAPRDRLPNPWAYDHCCALMTQGPEPALFDFFLRQLRETREAVSARDAFEDERRAVATRMEHLDAELRVVRGSVSFRLGRLLTRLPRALRDRLERGR